MTIRETAEFLQTRNDYLILTHRRPDGDTVGSACALCRGLRALGKRAVLYPNREIAARFAPLAEGLLGSEDPSGKTIVSVDIAGASLFPRGSEIPAEATALAVDHHGSHTPFAENTLVVPGAAACGEIILSLLDELGTPVTSEIAEALYVAISTDTGCFRYGNTTGDTHRAAARCLEAGANEAYWNRVLFLEKTLPRLRLEAYLTQNAEVYRDGKTALCILPQQILDEYGVTESELDDISGFPRDIAGVELGVMLRPDPDGCKVSVRTHAPWNASEICKLWGGGGHPAAAGATLPGTQAEARETILETLKGLGAI